jgi:hypothetical protein
MKPRPVDDLTRACNLPSLQSTRSMPNQADAVIRPFQFRSASVRYLPLSAKVVEPDVSTPLLGPARATRSAPVAVSLAPPRLLDRVKRAIRAPARAVHSLSAPQNWSLHCPLGGIASAGGTPYPSQEPRRAGGRPDKAAAGDFGPRRRKSAEASLKMQRAMAVSRQEALSGLFGAASGMPDIPAAISAPASMAAAVGLIGDLFPAASGDQLEQFQLALFRLPLAEGADRTVIAYALAAAAGGDIAHAGRILRLLAGGLDLHHRPTMRPVYRDAVTDGAWHAADLLSRTDAGFAMLRELHPAHLLFGRAARVILQAGSPALRAEGGAADVGVGSLAARASAAAHRMLQANGPLANADKAAIFAWEQGFRAHGPGTPLHAVQAHLQKFAHKTIPRVAESRWRSFLPRLAGKKKSPLSALVHGTQGAERSLLARERAALVAPFTRHAAGAKTGAMTAIRLRTTKRRGLRGPRRHRMAEVQQKLRALVNDMGSSARLRLDDGMRRGFSTKGLVCNLSTLIHLSGIPIGPRLNLGVRNSRRAVVEIASGTGSGEILIGSERRLRGTAGGGIMLGYDLRSGPGQIRCGISGDIERSGENRAFSGVALRVAQRKRADGSADEARLKTGMQRIFDFFFEQQGGPRRTDPAVLFERFAVRFFDDPDISIGNVAPTMRTRSAGASLTASAMAKIAATPLRFGPTATLAAERARITQRDSANLQGRLQSQSARRGKATAVSMSAGMRGKISVDAEGPGGTNPMRIGMLDASLPCWTAQIHAGGAFARVRLAREHGILQHRHCVLDTEFHTIDDYVAAVEADRWRWIRQLAQRHPGRPDALVHAETELAAHLASARRDAGSSQRFVMRCCLREDLARQIDRHGATAAAIRANAHLPQATRDRLCAAHEAACAALVEQAGAWVPMELKIIDTASRRATAGVLLGLQVAAETGAQGEHQLACLKV